MHLKNLSPELVRKLINKEAKKIADLRAMDGREANSAGPQRRKILEVARSIDRAKSHITPQASNKAAENLEQALLEVVSDLDALVHREVVDYKVYTLESRRPPPPAGGAALQLEEQLHRQRWKRALITFGRER